MNIFEILSQGKGSVNEENISAFLAYLLNPNETHGLKDIFLKRFLTLIDNNLATDDTLQLNDILLEERFYNSKNDWCSLDITLRLNNLLKNNIFIAVENKIKNQSIKQNQLQNEIDYMCDYKEIKEYNKKKIIFILPYENDEDKISDKVKFNLTKSQSDWECKIITWNIILKILKDILYQENNSEISPLCEYVRHTIKSFILYMNKLNERKLKITKEFCLYSTISNKVENFCIKQYSTNQAELYLKESGQQVSVKPYLYDFVAFCYPYIKDKNINTQYTADLFIKEISKQENNIDKYNELHS